MPLPAKKMLRVARWCAALFAIPALAVAGFLYYIGLFTGNVRTVVPGRVYRSAQLGPDRLAELIRRYHIRTVISLRGADRAESWYQREKNVCDRDGVQLRDISLSATHLPRPRYLLRLLSFFDTAQYPVLFHCRGGADRSGLAATLYLHLYAGLPLDEAQRQGLTWRYGHFPLAAAPMDQFFDLYRRQGDGMDLRSWIRQRYPEVYRSLRHDKDFPVRPSQAAVAAP